MGAAQKHCDFPVSVALLGQTLFSHDLKHGNPLAQLKKHLIDDLDIQESLSVQHEELRGVLCEHPHEG